MLPARLAGSMLSFVSVFGGPVAVCALARLPSPSYTESRIAAAIPFKTGGLYDEL